MMKTEEFQITLSSQVLNADHLQHTLAKWVEEYEGLLSSVNRKYIKYFCYTPSEDGNMHDCDATMYY